MVGDATYASKHFLGDCFERLSHLVRLVCLCQPDRSVEMIFVCDIFWKDPNSSLYDWEGHSDLIVMDSRLNPLLQQYADETSYQAAFDEHWNDYWSEDVITNNKIATPFFWVIDFIVYHELSHIILRHLDMYDNDTLLQELSRTSGVNMDILQNRVLAEAHADWYASQLLCATLPKLAQAMDGDPIDDFMRQNFLSLALLLQLLNRFMHRTRRSFKIYKLSNHIHPELRYLLMRGAVMSCMGSDEHRQAWSNAYNEATLLLRSCCNEIGALGLADSLWFPLASFKEEVLLDWQRTGMAEYDRLYASLSDFSRYSEALKRPRQSMNFS